MLGRDGGNGHHPTGSRLDLTILRIGLHILHEEFCGTFHHRIIGAQEVLVTCEKIVLPEMGCEPGTTRGEHAPGRTIDRSGDTPEVGVVVSHPTVTAVHLTSSELSRLTQVSDHVEERLLGLSQVAYKGRPVVHLGIDVDRVFRIPGGVQFVVPDTLQVGGLATGL